MNAKSFLMQYRHAATRAEMIKNELNDLKGKRDELQGFQVGERVQTSHDPDKIGAMIAQIADLEADLMLAKADALEIMIEVDSVINKVSDPSYQLLLHDRYIRLHKWAVIADDMHYSYTGIMAVHKRALAEIEKLI